MAVTVSELSPAMVWAIVGFLLLIVEMFTLSFVVVFFGGAALAVALLKVAGLNHLAAEIVLFGALGAACLFFFRGKLQRSFGKSNGHAIDQHQLLTASVDVPARATAKIEYQGTLWDAANDSDQPIRRGDKVRVVKTEGIKLVVRPEP